MRPEDISDEALTALADGELDASEAARLRTRIDRDPALAERYAVFAETRALLGTRGAEDAGLDRLAAAIRAADGPAAPNRFRVIAGGGGGATAPQPAAAPTPRRPIWSRAMPALAASLALVVGGALGFVAGRGGPAEGPTAGGLAAIAGAPGAERALAAALETTPSGETLAWSDGPSGLSGAIAVVATHRFGDGRVCREYEARVTGAETVAAGLGCRGQGGAWRTEIAAIRPAPGSGYAAASGASVIEGAIEALGGEGAMAETEEKALIASKWRRAAP